jgi:hypothetical protein
MPIYIFVRDDGFYPVEEVTDEKVIAHAPLNPGTRRIEDSEGRIVWQETKQ